MRAPPFLLPKSPVLALTALALAPLFTAIFGTGEYLYAQEAGDVVPASYQGSGSFFNRQLGTAFRFNYHNQGYGIEDDMVALGSMKVFNLQDATVFLDGQATLSEDFGGGFNLGVGYRELVQTVLPYDSQRIRGVSFWTDGQSTSADNFFTQLGFSLESLGDSVDVRLNGHFPLDRTKIGAPTLLTFDSPMYLGNHLISESRARATDTAYSVVDGELAKRIGDLEAWAFLGGYQLSSGGDDTTGYRVGVRGYALPDLAVSLQVTDDDLYDTHVVFGITWFIGRTHKGNLPCGNLRDRFREPVLRNDFIATTQTSEVIYGAPLTDETSGDVLRFVHLDSTAAAGGDGTIEKPLKSFANVPALSQEDDTILVHAGSVLPNAQYTAQNGQRILGEGAGIRHAVDTAELGVINLPETSPGARQGTIPIINGTGAVFALADNNELNNFTINGGDPAVVAEDVNAPVLRNLEINNTTGNGIELKGVTETSVIENTVSITDAGETALLVEGGSDAADLAPTITNTAGRSIDISNRTGGILTFNGTVFEEDGDGSGILVEGNTGGTINFTNSLTLDTGTNDAVRIASNTGTEISFDGGLDIDTTDGKGFFATGGGTVAAVGANMIDTETGVGLEMQNMTITNFRIDRVNVTNGASAGIILSTLDGTGQVIIGSGTSAGDGGTLTVAGTAVQIDDVNQVTVSNVTVNNVATDSNGVLLTSSEGDRAFFSGMNITTPGIGFRANESVPNAGGGELTVTATNTIETTSGTALDIKDHTINVAGVTFDKVSTSAGTGMGIELENLTGGTVTVGPNSGTAGAGGTLTTADTSISVNNVASALFQDVTVSSSGSDAVTVAHTSAASSDLRFDNLTVSSANSAGMTVTAGGAGELDVTVQNSSIDSVGTRGIVLDTGAGSNRVDLTLTNNSIKAAGDHAFAAVLNEGNADVRFLLEDNVMENASAASATMDVSVTTGLMLSATVGSQSTNTQPGGNSFTNNNNNAGRTAFAMEVNAAGATINLDLRGNTAAGGDVAYELTNDEGTFGIVDLSNTVANSNNVGPVEIIPNDENDFENLVPPIDQVTP